MNVYVECEDITLEWYQVSQVIVSEVEAKHVASFKLILPIVFGITKEGKPYINHLGPKDLKLQISSAIHTTC